MTPKGQTTGVRLRRARQAHEGHAAFAWRRRQQPVTLHAYDENRNRTRQTDANGHVVAMEYDDLNRLRKTTQDPGGLALVSETTQFD